MSVLGYIAGTLIVPNLADYFISKGIVNNIEERVMQEIKIEITEFNYFFEDTEVDSQYFVDFLKSKDISKFILDRVFASFDSVSIRYDNLSKDIAKEAIEYVNLNKKANGHPAVKKPELFEKYFINLFNSLINIRNSKLSMNEKFLVSTIDDSIKDTEHALTEKIEQSIGRNILLNEKIIDIENLIDRMYLSDAEEEISNIFEYVNNINLEQRVQLLFHKARIYIDTDDRKKIENLKNKIKSLDDNSKYYHEINYLIACKDENLNGIKQAITALKKLGIEDYKLQLKELHYKLMQNDYDSVLEVLTNECGEIKEIFIDESKAYYYLGIINLNQGKFREAYKLLEKAMEIKYHIAYEYNCVTAKTMNFFHEVRDLPIFDSSLRNKAEKLALNHERIQYFIKDLEVEIRLRYWCNYLHLKMLINPEDLLSKIDDIDKDLKDKEPIIAMISEAHYLLEHYSESIPYLERVWNLNPIFLMRLCNCYKLTKKWRELSAILKKAEIENFDEEGIIFFYLIEIDEKNGNINNAIEKIEKEGERYQSKPWFISRVIRFSLKHDKPELIEKFVGIALNYQNTFSLNDRLDISNVILETNFKSVVRELLEKDYKESEEGIALFLNSFGEVNPNNHLFTELKRIVMILYNNGVESRSVLSHKFLIEFTTAKYHDAYMTIQKYGEKVDKDEFYHLNNVQVVIHGSIEADVSSSVNYLLETSKLIFHIMAAQYFSHSGRWEETKRTLLQSFYKFSGSISEEETAGFVKIYLMNTHHHNTKVNFENVHDNTVVTLRNSNGQEKKYSLHSYEFLIEKEGEEKFGCFNYTVSNDVSLILKAVGTVGDYVELAGETYEVVEVLDINTFYFRYFLDKLSSDYPNNKDVIKISGKSPEELVGRMKKLIIKGKEDAETRLSLYNFEIEIGTPISYIFGKEPERYLDTIKFLLNNENEKLYSSYSSENIHDQKYILTISSLIIINELGYLERLNEIKGKIFIADSVKSFVRKGMKDAIKNSQLEGTTAFIDDDSNFKLYENSDTEKKNRNVFWTQILASMNQFKEVKAQQYENQYYDVLYEIIDVSDFDSIFLTSSVGGLLVTDDLFMSKINVSIGEFKNTLNAVGLLYSEKLISINELVEITEILSCKKVINCINHVMLFEIYVHLVCQYGREGFDELYSTTEKIFYNLFNESVIENHKELFHRFRELVSKENLITPLLFNLMIRPLDSGPYSNLIK